MHFSATGRWLIGAFLLSVVSSLLGYNLVYTVLRFSQAQSDRLTIPIAVSPLPSQTHGGYGVYKLTPAPAPETPNPLASVAMSGEATPTASGQSAVALPPKQQRMPTAAIQAGLAELREFGRRVVNGQPSSLCGLYVEGVLALRVVQQPADDPGFISTEDGTATQFQKADSFSAVGLLAHNTLAGRDFFKITPGQEMVLIYGDGRAEHFKVSQIAEYQRLTLADLRSDFLSLDNNGQETADQVFAKFYQRAHRLTLQTCLRRGNVADWGVHFIVAEPSQPSR